VVAPQQLWWWWTKRKQLWPCESAIKSQILDIEHIEHLANSKITENIGPISAGTKFPQKLVYTTLLSMEHFQSFQWEPVWVHSTQYLIAYSEFLQPLMRLCSRLIVIMVEYYVPSDVIMQLRQMWCKRLNFGNRINIYGKREKIEEIRVVVDLSTRASGKD